MSGLFDELSPQYDVNAEEQAVLDFWDEHDIFHKSLNPYDKKGKRKRVWIFYEGPPTANGKPHAGHVLTRAIKDLLPRYRTMCGDHVPRKAGWDTHGLPVEIEVEKELGISGKSGIEAFGVEPFIKKCQESVFRYTKDWEALTRRIGFWIDLPEAYITYTREYIESVWWALAEIHRKGLLYQGHKVLPWCPRCQTALSSHEVGLGYQDVDDPSIYVVFKSTSEPGVSYLAWTTTPWTLLSNVALAVGAREDYAYVKLAGETLVLAAARVDEVLAKLPGKVEYAIEKTVKGAELAGGTYEPLYNFAPPEEPAWRIITADFVTLETGTGIVHLAPAYGEDDQRAARAEGLPTIHLVRPDGTFPDTVKPFAGQFVKKADAGIIADLKARKLLLRRESYRHSYPHCWRCKGPLLYYARDAWFIRTTEKVQAMLRNNARIAWRPAHIQNGRFGNFLETNVDWALSRERYWGTPLPIWICEGCGEEEAFASLDALKARNPDALAYWNERKQADASLNEHLVIHKPFVDHVTVPCKKCPGTMRRVPEVIDCWFDSGAMPFAQWGYPHRASDEDLDRAFPADWISEAIDQTRGWFYSLLAISTLVFEDKKIPHPYRACTVLGHVCDEQGRKLSKQLQNFVPSEEILEREGADAVRWLFYSGTAPWNSSRFGERAVREARREFLIKLREIAKFFVTYANIDGFNPADDNPDAVDTTPEALEKSKGYRQAEERSELDRWALAELQSTIRAVREAMDDYDIYTAARALLNWVDALSNWYLRRSRRRFWADAGRLDAYPHVGQMGGPSSPFPPVRPDKAPIQDKYDAYWTLYEALVTTCKLAAPFVPFLTETLYQNLVRKPWPKSESVHLTDYPDPKDYPSDPDLVRRMDLVRDIVRLGHASRASAKIRVRQPLKSAILILATDVSKEDYACLAVDYRDIILNELNVKGAKLVGSAQERPEEYVRHEIKANFKILGPKYRQDVKAIKRILASLDGSAAHRELTETGKLTLKLNEKEIDLTPEEVEVRLHAKEGYVAAQGRCGVVVLNTELDDELIREGLARDINNRIQSFRKDLNLPYSSRIGLALDGDEELLEAAKEHAQYLKDEALVRDEIEFGNGKRPRANRKTFEIDGKAIHVTIYEDRLVTKIRKGDEGP